MPNAEKADQLDALQALRSLRRNLGDDPVLFQIYTIAIHEIENLRIKVEDLETAAREMTDEIAYLSEHAPEDTP